LRVAEHERRRHQPDSARHGRPPQRDQHVPARDERERRRDRPDDPVVRGRRIKLRYAHQGGKNPPIIVVHGSQTDSIPESYKRYLTNTFRKVLKVKGTPIRFEFRSGHNPYDNSDKDDRQKAKDRQLNLTKEARTERKSRR
ncbi:MAG: hypothetical protein R3204_08240, partial [Oceanospirillum sp.]|nr:hypothetical protein [Oceanospirillum sp.]